MKVQNHEHMHQDQRKWISDLNMWTHDVKMWEEELEALNQSIDSVIEQLTNHKSMIGDHIRKLILHRNTTLQHEMEMKFIREGSAFNEELTELHTVARLQHDSLQKDHVIFAKRNHDIMVLVRNFKMSLDNIDLLC